METNDFEQFSALPLTEGCLNSQATLYAKRLYVKIRKVRCNIFYPNKNLEIYGHQKTFPPKKRLKCFNYVQKGWKENFCSNHHKLFHQISKHRNFILQLLIKEKAGKIRFRVSNFFMIIQISVEWHLETSNWCYMITFK